MWPFNRNKKTEYVWEIDPSKAETFGQLKALTILSLYSDGQLVKEPIRVRKQFLMDYPEANALVTKKENLSNEHK